MKEWIADNAELFVMIMFIIIVALLFGFYIEQNYETDRAAIKAGLVQKPNGGNTIWTKP